jgi:flagellar export protein FliJ
MSGMRALMEFAERRCEGALIHWQRLKTQCDEARQKLVLLRQHHENYRNLLRSGLEQGMAAISTNAYMGFIGQIEAIVVRQENEIGNLEEACSRQWQVLVDARREKRMYEILSERTAAREAEARTRREQTEIDTLLQRTVKPSL